MRSLDLPLVGLGAGRGIQNELAEVCLDPITRTLGAAAAWGMTLLKPTMGGSHLQPNGCN
jgi:hypothetical protein